MKNILVLFILTLLIVSLLISGCSQGTTTTSSSAPPASKTTAAPAASSSAPPATQASSSTAPRYGGTWKMILTGGISNIGQLGAQAEITGGMYPRVSRPAIETLWNYDNNEKTVPKLAESYEISPDGKTLIIKCRKGVKFHDGTDWNAKAVAENFNLIKESTVNAAYGKSLFANIAGYEVMDDYTLKVNYSKFDAKFMASLAERGMVSPTAARKATTPENMAKDHMIGTGPFLFVDYTRAQFVKYTKKNPTYWQSGKPYLDGIQMNEFADGVTALMSFKNGEGQLIFGITPKDSVDLLASGFDILKSSRSMINYICPDGANKDSVWSNIKVRQAAEYAIDKKAIASLGSGIYSPVTHFANPGDITYNADLVPRNYDPAKAKALLAEAGYPNGFKSKLLAGTSYNKEILVALQTYLKDVGIDCTLDIFDTARSADIRTNGWKDGILCMGVPIVGPLSSYYTSMGPTVYPSMYRGDFQKRMDEAISEPDYNKRMTILKEMVRLLYADTMCIPIWSAPDISGAVKDLKGDIQWMVGHPNFFEPQNAWLAK